jgi:fumarate reductase subunit C
MMGSTMSAPPVLYTPYHPRWLRRRVSTYWWLKRWSYVAFILRELSSIFVAWGVLYLLLLVRAVSHGDAAYRQFLDWSATRAIVALNLVSVLFVVYHAITWFNLASQAMVMHAGRRRVPGAVITASNYVAWLLISALVIWFLAGGGR